MSRPGPFTACAVASSFGRDVDATLFDLAMLLGRARYEGVGLVVLPECALGGYILEPGVADQFAPQVPPAVSLDGPEIARLVDHAGDVVLVVGITEEGRDGDLYSTLVCLSGEGVHGVHRKVHLPPSERFIFSAGSGFAAFDTPVGRMGMLVCYDKCFPEAARALALDGADLIVSAAAWPADRRAPAERIENDRQTLAFDALDVARAVENQVTWVSTNVAGRQGSLRFLGRSRIVDPHGVTLAETGHEGGVAVAEIAPAEAAADARSIISHLTDRRPASYTASGRIDALSVAEKG